VIECIFFRNWREQGRLEDGLGHRKRCQDEVIRVFGMAGYVFVLSMESRVL